MSDVTLASRSASLIGLSQRKNNGLSLRLDWAATYAMAERGKPPGIERIGSPLIFRQDALLLWLARSA